MSTSGRLRTIVRYPKTDMLSLRRQERWARKSKRQPPRRPECRIKSPIYIQLGERHVRQLRDYFTATGL